MALGWNKWTADRRLYLDANGKVVEANDPTKLTLLIAPGQSMPLTEAQRLGLVPVAAEPEQEPAKPVRGKRGPSETKED